MNRSQGDRAPVIKGAILFFGVFRAKGNILLFSHLVSKGSKDTDVTIDRARALRGPKVQPKKPPLGSMTLPLNKAPSMPPLFLPPTVDRVPSEFCFLLPVTGAFLTSPLTTEISPDPAPHHRSVRSSPNTKWMRSLAPFFFSFVFWLRHSAY